MRFFLVILFSLQVQAQSFNDELTPPDMKSLRQEGQMLAVQITFGKNKKEPMRFFVVGKEQAKLDLSNLKLTVRQLKPYPAKVLRLTKSGESFALADEFDYTSPADIEVKTEVKNKVETFHFKLNNSPR